MPVSGIGMHVCGPTIHDCGKKSKQSVQAPCLPACMLLYPENSLQNASKSRRRILEYSRTTMPNPSPTHGGILLKRSYKPEYRLPCVQPNLNTPHPVTPYPKQRTNDKTPDIIVSKKPAAKCMPDPAALDMNKQSKPLARSHVRQKEKEYDL